MFCFQQYEVWERRGTEWELIASFTDYEPAAAVASRRRQGIRMFLASYKDAQLTGQDFFVRIEELREYASEEDRPQPRKSFWHRGG